MMKADGTRQKEYPRNLEALKALKRDVQCEMARCNNIGH